MSDEFSTLESQNIRLIEAEEKYYRDRDIAKLESLAKMYGYKLVPIKKYERFLPCKCGCNRRDHIYCSNCKTNKDYVVLKCKKCGFKVYGTNEATAKQRWNKVMSLLDQIVEEKPEDLKEIWETL